jgi:energy-coupling factor transporter transmembrane protein EcfT
MKKYGLFLTIAIVFSCIGIVTMITLMVGVKHGLWREGLPSDFAAIFLPFMLLINIFGLFASLWQNSKRCRQKSLDQLVEAITPDNRHGETFSDTPVGNEFPNGHKRR